MIFISDFLQAAGSLAGLAVGDALGAPCEGLSPAKRRIRGMHPSFMHGLRGGRVTDDTLQALAITESLLICGRFTSEDIMKRLLRAYRKRPYLYGPTSSAVFLLVTEGKSPYKASETVWRLNGSMSNGCIMRGAPLGVFYRPENVRFPSIACAYLTHMNPVSAECSVFVNRMVSELCRGAEKKTAYARSIKGCRIPLVRRMLSVPKAASLRPSMDALEATHCALSLFLIGESFEERVSLAASLGGDTDTIGAICGALAGAEMGISSIPRRWLDRLEYRDRIIRMADELAASAEF